MLTALRQHPASLLLALAGTCAGVQADESGPDAVSFLAFESVLDGKCQILSDGGKLRILRNTHPDIAVDFRLMRVFAGVPQGLTTGRAAPAGDPVKLGCTLVDGRNQDWTVDRARFAAEES